MLQIINGLYVARVLCIIFTAYASNFDLNEHLSLSEMEIN